MIDKLEIRTTLENGSSWLLHAKHENINKYGQDTYYGSVGNFKIIQNINGVKLTGSIAKYLNGESMTTLTRNTINKSVGKLETDTGIDMHKATVTSIEIGTCVILERPTVYYLKNFAQFTGKNKTLHYGKNGDLQTVTFSTEHGSYRFRIYDKTKEMESHKEKIPEMFQGCNVLRLELVITKKEAICKAVGKEITPWNIADHDIYRKLVDTFYNFYQRIEKVGNEVYCDTQEPLTPATLEAMCAEQYRQSHYEEYQILLQSAKEKGCLNNRNSSRIKQNIKTEHKSFLIQKSELNAELDQKIKDRTL